MTNIKTRGRILINIAEIEFRNRFPYISALIDLFEAETLIANDTNKQNQIKADDYLL